MLADADIVMPHRSNGRRWWMEVIWAPFDVGRRFIGLGEPIVLPAAAAQERNLGWLVPLTIATSCWLLLIAVSMSMARAGTDGAVELYWTAIVAIITGPALRLCYGGTSRTERFWLAMLLGQALLIVKMLLATRGFVHFDELLHVATANGIIENEQLYSLNPLLPISALFPGLEIVTAAMVKLTGLSIFASGSLLIMASRAIFVAGMFLLMERLTSSERIAGVACLIYIGNANFSLFHAQYAYESLAVALLMVALYADVLDVAHSERSWTRTIALLGPFLPALAVTHHTTATFLGALLIVIGLLELFRTRSIAKSFRALVLGTACLMAMVSWSKVTGDPTAGYIGPLIQQGFDELYRFVSGQSAARRLFVSDDGVEQHFLRRFTSLGAVILVLLGLLVGFLRSFTLAGAGGRKASFFRMVGDLFQWTNSRLLAIVLLTLVFPVSLAFRLTAAGWELGSRLGALSFIGVCLVVAVSIVCYLQAHHDTLLRTAIASFGAVVIAMGGVIIGWGVVNLPTGYRVAGDAMSVERTGIDAARWSREMLGAGKRFGADRINRLLLATYGRQIIVTTLLHHVDMSKTFFMPNLTASELYDIRAGRVDFLLVDMRLSTEKPLMGVYFERGEPAWVSATPPTVDALLKFNHIPGVNRLYDSGAIKIVDVRAIRNANQIP